MKFFIDTANVDEIREISKWGILDGVTTNPSLIAKEGRDFVEVITEIAKVVPIPITFDSTFEGFPFKSICMVITSGKTIYPYIANTTDSNKTIPNIIFLFIINYPPKMIISKKKKNKQVFLGIFWYK